MEWPSTLIPPLEHRQVGQESVQMFIVLNMCRLQVFLIFCPSDYYQEKNVATPDQGGAGKHEVVFILMLILR